MTIAVLPKVGLPAKATPRLKKIAFEEHFSADAIMSPGVAVNPEKHAANLGLEVELTRILLDRLRDLHCARIEEMDAAGIDIAVLSLQAAGIEGIADAHEAINRSRKINDFLANEVQRSNGRFAGFASVPLQDPQAAAAELRRAVLELGFVGVMVNGYVSKPDGGAWYLDDARFMPFWQTVSDLAVPVYIHPRPSLPAVQDALYAGHPELVGATWGFAPETATHALRLVYSGLFDRFPKVQVILGHMGETLPFFAWRIQHCFEYNPLGHQVERRLQDYLADNFYITTSGNCSDQALICALLTVGADRICFSTDYPYERSDEAARWIERAPISEGDRRKIAHGNAAKLFNLRP
ncbi:amidohydrolase family protein [Buttiauxella ferragutiae]|uniref:amidohydrolase family protein n=1 Tax=Buttiauxella ferragutiae TaxID=82989 RepID=UPI003523CF0C